MRDSGSRTTFHVLLHLRFFDGELYLSYVGGVVGSRPLHIDLADRPGHTIAVGLDPGHQLAVRSSQGVKSALVDDTGHLLDVWQFPALHPSLYRTFSRFDNCNTT
jgi:hypothetical protein